MATNLKQQMLDPSGFFGEYGGRYVPELLVPVMDELNDEFYKAIKDEGFLTELKELYNNYSGRPTPLYHCKNLSDELGGAQIYLKNEGLNHTGAHKINHCLGQGLLAKRMGKTRIIAETGAGQHGLASATIAAKLGLECTVYMGRKDYNRQRPNVFWMELLGATVIPVETGGMILRDAINEAMRDLINNPIDSHYLLGTVCGPRPYPAMNTFFQSIVGKEIREQLDGLPDLMIASCGGGSNAMGLFHEFLDDESVKMTIVEAGGTSGKIGEHAARFTESGRIGVAEGMKSMMLQDKDGQLQNTASISAGLDYSGVGPQISYLVEQGRVKPSLARDSEVLEAFRTLVRTEGIIPALESSHAVVETIKQAPKMSKDKKIVFNCSGRGDKDLFITAKQFDHDNFNQFLKEYIS
jgi:tryptophan synthase beta chain